PGAGTILHAGGSQSLSVLFTPNDSAHYDTATRTVTINVSPAPLTVTADDKSKPYGDLLPALTASYSGFVNGDTPASLTTPPTPVDPRHANRLARLRDRHADGDDDRHAGTTHRHGG